MSAEDGSADTELMLAGGRALFGGGVYIGRVVDDGGGVDGRGGSIEVGEGGKLERWPSSDGRRL